MPKLRGLMDSGLGLPVGTLRRERPWGQKPGGNRRLPREDNDNNAVRVLGEAEC